VDRDANIATHFWICNSDGSDPRAPHGNYPFPYSTIDLHPSMPKSEWYPLDRKRDRPFAEWHIRAVPQTSAYNGSSKFTLTAGPHHGEPYGALALLDINVEDDGAMSQLRRITTNKFPESETGGNSSIIYGFAWPFSEAFYLCNYNTSLVILDRFGNREIIPLIKENGENFTMPNRHRPEDPIPLRARQIPPEIPMQTFQGERESMLHQKATISIMDVYNSGLPLPEGTKINELRIIQYFPKSTKHMDKPMIGYATESLARMVLGTVPVEEDGSVFFEAPVNKGISFQLIDDKGMAFQLMRSLTYVHPGEQMSCAGCHENRWEAIPINPNPIAMQRPPSKIQPEVGGREPLNFHRLVAPVVQDKCAPCHSQMGAGPGMSYESLRDWAYFTSGGIPVAESLGQPLRGGSRSIPGKHGAYGAPLYTGGYLDTSHYNVSLTDEERRRITMWLDCNYSELGAYKDEAAQRNGELVWPEFDLDRDNPLGVEKVPWITPVLVRRKEIPAFKVDWIGNTVCVHVHAAETYLLTVATITGKTVLSRRVNGSGTARFSVKDFGRGIYVIRIHLKNQVLFRRLLVAHWGGVSEIGNIGIRPGKPAEFVHSQ